MQNKDKKCKRCKKYGEVQTDYGIVRRCNQYKILLEEKYVEEKRPSWCRV